MRAAITRARLAKLEALTFAKGRVLDPFAVTDETEARLILEAARRSAVRPDEVDEAERVAARLGPNNTTRLGCLERRALAEGKPRDFYDHGDPVTGAAWFWPGWRPNVPILDLPPPRLLTRSPYVKKPER